MNHGSNDHNLTVRCSESGCRSYNQIRKSENITIDSGFSLFSTRSLIGQFVLVSSERHLDSINLLVSLRNRNSEMVYIFRIRFGSRHHFENKIYQKSF